MNAWVTLGASVLGGVVAAAAALGGVAIAQRGENARATKSDRQGLRDQKAERLRRLYEPLVEFSLVLQQVAREKAYVLEGDSVEERDRRHQRQLAEGMHRVGTVIAATVIEPGTTEVRGAYEVTYGACDTYLRSLSMNARVPASTSLVKLNEQFRAIEHTAEALQATVLKQLKEMEKPI